MEREKILFTSESVTEGHPDKMCDQISDAILDELMRQDPMSRVACETCCTTGLVMVMGEITTKAYVDIQKIVRDTVREIGYTRGKYGFDADTCGVISTIDEQSADIAMGVDQALEAKEHGMSEEELDQKIERISVYARVSPENKIRIVEAWQEQGEVVAMTGDGVNDAPALKNASIGVAMGSGTDVAKESGDMIIQDDNFETIVTAIREGRKIYDNIKRFVKFQVSTNVGAILTIVGTSIFMLPVPFNPVQLLWINIVMDGPPAQTLGMEGSERNIMTRQAVTGDILN